MICIYSVKTKKKGSSFNIVMCRTLVVQNIGVCQPLLQFLWVGLLIMGGGDRFHCPELSA